MKQLSFFLVITLVSLVACKKSDSGAGAASAPPAAASGKNAYAVNAVEGFIVRPAPLSESVTASGTLLASEETELHPEASGRVVSLNLPEGKTVKKGDLLLKVFDEDLKTQLRKLETSLKQAEITEQRLGELLKVKGVSQQEYDLAALQVQTLHSEIDLVKINIAKTELRAPYDGVLGLRRISPGAYVTPATAVTSIRSAGGLKLDFAVPEKYSAQLRTGQTVKFRVEGNSVDHVAVIQATAQSIETDTRQLQVRALVSGNTRDLLPGAFAEVGLNLGNKQRALMVPNQAVIPQARNKQVILCKGGKAQFITVKTGVRQADMIEILDGVSEGDTLATTGVLFLKPDAPVKFSKVN